MENKMVTLILNVVVLVLVVIGVFLIIGAMGTGAEIDPETKQEVMDVSSVSSSVNFTLILFWVSLALIALATVWGVVQNPKRFIPTGIGVAVFGVLVLIASSMVTVETSGDIVALEEATEGTLFWGGLGIQTTFVLTAVAIILILLQSGVSIMRYFQK